MSSCCCSLAGTKACETCSNYPNSLFITTSFPNDDFRDTAKMIEGLPSVQSERKESDWIPCSERLPDKSGEYLVTDDGWPITTVDVGVFFCENGVSVWLSHDHVVAWMPAPEPYRGEQDD